MKLSIKKSLLAVCIAAMSTQAYSVPHVEKNNDPVVKSDIEVVPYVIGPEERGFNDELYQLEKRINMLVERRDNQSKGSVRFKALDDTIAELSDLQMNIQENLTTLSLTPVTKKEPLLQKIQSDILESKVLLSRAMAE